MSYSANSDAFPVDYSIFSNESAKRKEPAQLGFLMRKSFTDPTMHAIRRYALTYIYVLLLRKTARLLGGGMLQLAHATVQARKGSGKGGTEGAHMLLREATFGGVPVYALPQVPKGLMGALVYCAAQVTITPALYNRADQLLEEPEITLKAYLKLIQETIAEEADTQAMRERLFDKIITLFDLALTQGAVHALTAPKEKAAGASLLPQYRLALLKLQAWRKTFTTRDTEGWMYAIRVKGGWEWKDAQAWEDIQARIPTLG